MTYHTQVILDRKDRLSMSTGLEVRVPYCDYRFAKYVWNVPWKIKALEGREKGLEEIIFRLFAFIVYHLDN